MAESDAAAQWPKTLTLPSGKAAVVRRGTGDTIMRSARLVGAEDRGNPMALAMAHLAVKLTLDGRHLTYEEVLELDEDDVYALLGMTQGKGPTSPPSTSLP
jgi:hypothetical protein